MKITAERIGDSDYIKVHEDVFDYLLTIARMSLSETINKIDESRVKESLQQSLREVEDIIEKLND